MKKAKDWYLSDEMIHRQRICFAETQQETTNSPLGLTKLTTLNVSQFFQLIFFFFLFFCYLLVFFS